MANVKTPAPPRSSAGLDRGFIVPLESIRGLAALAVALFHSFHILPVNGTRVFSSTIWEVKSADALWMRLIMIPFNGMAAVSLFFVLSGYVLSLSLHRDPRAFWPKTLGFAVRRFFRIYPPLALNLILMFAVPALLAKVCSDIAFTLPTPAQLRTNLLMYDFPINGATWTLLIEIAAIPFLILGWLLRRRLGLRGSFLFLGICLIPSIAPQVTHRMLFGGFLFLFAIGSLVADLGSEGLFNKVRMSPAVTLVLATAVLLSARFFFGHTSISSLRMEGISAAVLIGVIAYGPRLAIHRILEAAPLRFLGRTSYSFYLYHPMTLAITMTCLPALASQSCLGAHPFLWSAFIALVSISTAIPLAWASFAFVEKPTVRLGRKF